MEPPGSVLDTSVMQNKKRDDDEHGARTQDNRGRLKLHRIDMENIGNNVPHQAACVFSSSCVNFQDTCPVSQPSQTNKRKFDSTDAVQDSILTSSRLKHYLSEEQIFNYRKANPLQSSIQTVIAANASQPCCSNRDLISQAKRKAKRAPSAAKHQVKRFRSNHDWRGELHMPRILAQSSTLALKFPTLANGRPPDP